jgi:hypothetical protein
MLPLAIIAADVLDAEVRELDGTGDGQPRDKFVVTLNSGGGHQLGLADGRSPRRPGHAGGDRCHDE